MADVVSALFSLSSYWFGGRAALPCCSENQLCSLRATVTGHTPRATVACGLLLSKLLQLNYIALYFRDGEALKVAISIESEERNIYSNRNEIQIQTFLAAIHCNVKLMFSH